jgi:hypothetical protein
VAVPVVPIAVVGIAAIAGPARVRRDGGRLPAAGIVAAVSARLAL